MRAAALSALVLLCTACVDEPTTPCPSTPAPAVSKAAEVHGGFEYVGLGGFEPLGIARMMSRAKESDSDAVIVLRDGKILIEEYFSKGKKPIRLMSATKSVTNLAIGALLLRDPKISLDEPVMNAFPSVHTDEERSKITLRQIMNHTSGLASEPSDWNSAKNGTPGVFEHFLKLPMPVKRGEDFRYNNPAVDILGPFITQHTKQHEDEFLQKALFDPMGIHSATWLKDKDGEVFASGSLQMDALDFAKLGQLVLQDGVWEGKRLLPEGWVAMSTKPSQSFNENNGLLWWMDVKSSATLTTELLDRYEGVGVPPEIVAKLRPLADREFSPSWEFWKARNAALSADERTTLANKLQPLRIEAVRAKKTGPLHSFYADGYGGQFLVVIPSKKIVAVRMRAVKPGEDEKTANTHSDSDFKFDARVLVGDFEE